MSETLDLAITYRPAVAADAADIARLFLMSSDGIAEYIWRKIDPEASDIIAVGTRRYARENEDFGYQSCILAEAGGTIAGMVHAFSMPDTPSDPEPDPDPVLRPYSELEHPGSFYVAGLAVHSGYRRAGIGHSLMQRAEDRAKSLGHDTISLICFIGNPGAMAFYEDLGYRETGRRAIVPTPFLKYEEGDAALLVKDLR
jgi:ribosomal protein S18 acetylase RimI-like enzyme